MAVKHQGLVRHHEDTARRQLKEYEGTIGGQVIFLRILDLSETGRYMKDIFIHVKSFYSLPKRNNIYHMFKSMPMSMLD